MPLQIQPIDVAEAFEFVAKLHRHHRPPQGYKLCIGVNDGEKLVGVLIAGRPVARLLDDGMTLEVTRCCTDGTYNACSMLYAHAWKAAKSLGYTKMITYTLPEEGGASLKATGWKNMGDAGGGKWSNNLRNRSDDHPLCVKTRWEVESENRLTAIRIRDGNDVEDLGMFSFVLDEAIP